MSSEGIKPDHHPITEVPPDHGARPGSSLPPPFIPVPNLGSVPACSASTIGFVLAVFLILWTGVLVGEGFSYHLIEPPVSTLGAGLSFLLLITGTILTSRSRPTQDRDVRLTVSLLVIGYCTMTVVCEPFLLLGDRGVGVQRLILPIGWLIPLLLAAVWFARRRCWFQAIGVALFIFVSVGLITYNLYRGYAGFLSRIRE
jgi:hypothetical protein